MRKFNMPKSISCLLFASIITSCATITSRKKQDLTIFSDIPNAKIRLNDSLYTLPAKIEVKRSKKNLNVQLISDTSIVRNYTIKSSATRAFLYGNLIWMQAAPIAYLVDITNPKKFHYTKTAYLKKDDTIGLIRTPLASSYRDYVAKSFSDHRGQTNLSIALPHINSFYLQPQNIGSKRNTGFLGFALGLEHFYAHNKFLCLRADAVTDFIAPFPAVVDFRGEHESMASLYLSLTDNKKHHRFTFGYGLNYSRNVWQLSYYRQIDSVSSEAKHPISKVSHAAGTTVNTYHQFGKHFFAGIIYRPTFLRVNPSLNFKYEHLISVDFMLKLRLKK